MKDWYQEFVESIHQNVWSERTDISQLFFLLYDQQCIAPQNSVYYLLRQRKTKKAIKFLEGGTRDWQSVKKIKV